MPGSDDYGDPPEDPGDGTAEAYEAIRSVPRGSDVPAHEPIGAEVAFGIGAYLGAVLTGLADKTLFDSTLSYLVGKATGDDRRAYLAALGDARRVLRGVFTALSEGHSLQLVSKAARLFDPPDDVGWRRARLVDAMESALGDFYETGGDLDGLVWVDTLARLRDIEPALRDVDSETIRTALNYALTFCNKPTRTAARLSLELDLFGDRVTYLDGKTRLEVAASTYGRAVTALKNAYDLAKTRYPLDYES